MRGVADRCEQQHLFDERGEPSGLAADDRPVLRDLLAFVNDPESDVVGLGVRRSCETAVTKFICSFASRCAR